MIQAKFKIQDKWEYRDFKDKSELDTFLKENEGRFSDYKIKEDETKNMFSKWWKSITHTKSNWKKVKSSPYASLLLAYKARKIIIGLLIPYMLWMTYKMVVNYQAVGFMNTVGRIITVVIMGFIIYKIWSTIPQAKKQIDYYKKYPHTINYCPTNTKETIDDIFAKIKENKEKEVKQDVWKKETSSSRSTKTTSNT